jgi:hypothetical protein
MHFCRHEAALFHFYGFEVTNKIQAGIKNKPLGSKQGPSPLSSKTSLLPLAT